MDKALGGQIPEFNRKAAGADKADLGGMVGVAATGGPPKGPFGVVRGLCRLGSV